MQADSCGLDLVGNYSLRYRLCDDHIKSLSVLHCGIPKRFCQQCSRLHDVNEFDGKRRSCRERLQLHKARQRAKLAKKGLLGMDDDDSSAPSTPIASHTPPTPFVPTPGPTEESKRPSKVAFNDEPQVREFYTDPVGRAAENGAQRIILEITGSGDSGSVPVRLSTTLMKPARPMRTWKSMGSEGLTAAAVEAQSQGTISGRSISWGGHEIRRIAADATESDDCGLSEHRTTPSCSGRPSTDGSEFEDISQERLPLSMTLSRGFSSGDILKSLSNLEELGISTSTQEPLQ